MEATNASEVRRSLAGDWRFELDPEDVGVEERWFTRELGDVIELPGTTNERGKGERRDDRPRDHLAEPYPYEGAAWYQTTVSIPDEWTGRRILLSFERTRVTRVWVDDALVGTDDALSTPQQYDLSEFVTGGEHTLTVRVDNDTAPVTYPGVQRSHMATEHTQTNWNGIVGDIELAVTDPVWIDDVRVDARTSASETSLQVTVGNRTGEIAEGHVAVEVEALDGDYSATLEPAAFTVAETSTVEFTDQLGEDPPQWDEFDPNRLRVTVSLAVTTGGTDYAGEETTTVGVREFATDGTQFTINGTTTFLRGTVDSCIFPETGYAPTDEKTWREHLGIVREYGLNHVRFHSWCPPEAAFEAADELGLYLQPELPLWNNGGAFEDDDAAAYFRAEAERILDTYGNHPSFVTFALGNELAGDFDAMHDLVEDLRDDDRRLYAAGAYNGLSNSTFSACDDFWITASIPVDPEDARGDRHMVRGSNKRLESEPPSTNHDYADAIADVPVPVVSHEIGQFQVYPDFSELSKYDGALEPDNLAVARDHLEAHGMLDAADEFADASGRLALECYREEVEAAIRTPGLGGFELLALQDFPGQGTALVGLLDSFMDSKGLVDPEEWRRFCSPVVPLARMDSRTWTSAESLVATVQVANYGPEPVTAAEATWQLVVDDAPVASGDLPPVDVAQGELVDLGTVDVSLHDVDAPAKATLELDVDGLGTGTKYDVWVYPAGAPEPDTDDEPTVRRAFDEATRDLLADGEDVLLVPDHEDVSHSFDGAFHPSFWSYALFKRNAPSGTMGPVLDPDHPAFAAFPTEGHGDWQWWHLLTNARPVTLEDAPDDYRPIVQMADNVERNRKLGVVFETAVDDGNLLVCTIDLFACAEQPTARQFYASLAAYARSDAFDPEREVSEAILRKLIGS